MTTDTRDPATGDASHGGPGPRPDPALQAFAPFIGTWRARGHYLGSDEETLAGTMTFSWLPGGFFVRQDVDIDFAGAMHVVSHEIIGYDPETGAFPSTVYSNMAPAPLPYLWRVEGDRVTITVDHGPLSSTFEGRLSDDGTAFSGTWRPRPGADPDVNVSYAMTGTRTA